MTSKNTKITRSWCGRTEGELLQALDRLILAAAAFGLSGLAWMLWRLLQAAWEWLTLVGLPIFMFLFSAAALVTCLRWWLQSAGW